MLQDAIRIGRGRIQQLGTAFYVHLPVIYRRETDLKKGDEVDLFFQGGDELIVKPVQNAGGGSE